MTEREFQDKQMQARSWCNPVTTGDTGVLATSYVRSDANRSPISSGGPSADCWPQGSETAPNAPKFEPDPALDSNICTHPPGYWPRPQWCRDPNDEYCGLFGYALYTLIREPDVPIIVVVLIAGGVLGFVFLLGNAIADRVRESRNDRYREIIR